MLPAARIIKMIAHEWRAPVRKHADETFLLDIWRSHVFGYIGEPVSDGHGIERERAFIEGQLAFDTHFQFAKFYNEYAIPAKSFANMVAFRNQRARGGGRERDSFPANA